MIRFFASLTGVAALMSSPVLVLGVFMVVVLALSWIGREIGTGTGTTTIFTVIALVILWLAPVVVFILSLASTDREIRVARSENVQMLRRGRIPGALGMAAVGLLVPSLILMIISGFVASEACERGDVSGLNTMAYSPIGVVVRAFAPMVGVSSAIAC